MAFPGEFGGGFRVGEVADDDVRPPADRFDLRGDGLQFGLGARADDDVGADFGEGHRDRGTQPARQASVTTAT